MEDAYRTLNWEWDYQEEDQLKLAQFHSMLDLKTRIACTHKEIARKRDEVFHINCLLTKIINERDDFQFKCRILSENLILQHVNKRFEHNASFIRATHTSYTEDGPIIKLVSSLTQEAHALDNVVLTKRLPEKGRFLQAMMDAGPLLQNLLVVGPLPRWRNEPPKS